MNACTHMARTTRQGRKPVPARGPPAFCMARVPARQAGAMGRGRQGGRASLVQRNWTESPPAVFFADTLRATACETACAHPARRASGSVRGRIPMTGLRLLPVQHLPDQIDKGEDLA